MIVGEESGDADLSPLADAIEKNIDPPYRAVGTRQDGDLWGVGAKRIQVAQIAFPTGDKLEFSRNDATRRAARRRRAERRADPAGSSGSARPLGASYFVEAQRIDGDFWEVRATAF